MSPDHFTANCQLTWNMPRPTFPKLFPVTFILLSGLRSVYVKFSLRMTKHQAMRAYGGMLLPFDILYLCISAVDGNPWLSSHRFTIYESFRSLPLARIHNWSQKRDQSQFLIRMELWLSGPQPVTAIIDVPPPPPHPTPINRPPIY
jgi:hypothetical protein